MPEGKLVVTPNVNVERTGTDNVAGVIQSNFIRWRQSDQSSMPIPEKRGGWTKFINAVFAGITRALHAWQGLSATNNLAIGTTTNLYVVNINNVNDITAQSTTVAVTTSITTTLGITTVSVNDTASNLTVGAGVVFNTPVSVDGIVLNGAYQVVQSAGANAYVIDSGQFPLVGLTGGVVPFFTTTSNSSSVNVLFPNHGFVVGNLFFVYSNSPTFVTTVGGVTIAGLYIVQSVTDANNFTIFLSNSASNSASAYMGGSNQMDITHYQLNGIQAFGTGYGIGGYGKGGYGTGSQPAGFVPGTPILATDYWLDNVGATLLSLPTGGPLFSWSATTGFKNSQLVANAPIVNNGMFVSLPQQQVFLWGSTFTGQIDPLQIRWSDIFNFNSWTPTNLNQAGNYRIPTGSRIVRGMQGPQQLFWFTDIDLYISQYVGPGVTGSTVWSFNKIATGCGLIAPKAIGSASSGLYWMSQKQFWKFAAGEGVSPIECPVWDAVFQNLNQSSLDHIRTGTNAQFNEVTWFYPSLASSGENDSYVTYNWLFNEWDLGSIVRTAWIDQSVLGGPIGASTDGYVYQHETSPDAAGQPINASFSTGYFNLNEGHDFVFVDRAMPDLKWGPYTGNQTATVNLTFNVLEYPNDPAPQIYGPFPMTRNVTFIEPRFRGRFVQLQLQSSDLGSFWRLGAIRYRYALDGRR